MWVPFSPGIVKAQSYLPLSPMQRPYAFSIPHPPHPLLSTKNLSVFFIQEYLLTSQRCCNKSPKMKGLQKHIIASSSGGVLGVLLLVPTRAQLKPQWEAFSSGGWAGKNSLPDSFRWLAVHFRGAVLGLRSCLGLSARDYLHFNNHRELPAMGFSKWRLTSPYQ